MFWAACACFFWNSIHTHTHTHLCHGEGEKTPFHLGQSSEGKIPSQTPEKEAACAMPTAGLDEIWYFATSKCGQVDATPPGPAEKEASPIGLTLYQLLALLVPGG